MDILDSVFPEDSAGSSIVSCGESGLRLMYDRKAYQVTKLNVGSAVLYVAVGGSSLRQESIPEQT